jgi:hypothetical protein
MGVSRNTERAEAIVALAITVQPGLKMRSREAQSSWFRLTERTTWEAVSHRIGFRKPSDPLVCDRLICIVPSNHNYKPRGSGGTRKKMQQRGYASTVGMTLPDTAASRIQSQ